MKIGIVADIHQRVYLFEAALEHLVKQGVEALFIAGDIVKKEALILAKQTELPLFAVFGNNDMHLHPLAEEFDIKTEPYYFEYGGISFKMAHLPFFLAPDAEVVIFGHTHIQAIQKSPQTLFINPGEICAREKNKSECAMLEVLGDKYIVQMFYSVPNSEHWECETHEFAK